MLTFSSWRRIRNSLVMVFLLAVAFVAVEIAWNDPRQWIWAAPITFAVYAAWQAYAVTHPFRRHYWFRATPEAASPDFEKVLIKSRDGLRLFGWYLPGRNRAALILVHGLGGAGVDMVFHAAPLVRAGYSVLLIDLRAHGSSDGDTATFGRLEANDVAGAADYLITRPDVDADKIGVLGISHGAQAALRGALMTDRIRAVVTEGLGPSIFDDHGGRPKTLQRWLNYPFNWLYYSLCEFMMGGKDTGVLKVIGNLAPRPLMMIACGNFEMHFHRMFFPAANEPKSLWELPYAMHGAALAYAPKEYPQRVIAFFDNALGVQSSE